MAVRPIRADVPVRDGGGRRMWWNVTGHTRPRQIAVATANAAIWTARPVRSSAAPAATAADLARLAVRSHRGLRDLSGLAANLANFMPISA